MKAVNGDAIVTRRVGKNGNAAGKERRGCGNGRMLLGTAPPMGWRSGCRTGLTDLLDRAGADTARADMHAHVGALGAQRLYALKVRLGYFLGSIVRMAHLIAAECAFTTDLTCTCHGVVLLDRENDCLKSRRMLP